MSEYNYSCNTCGMSFGSAQFQREHMHTDWHRYNLKRRVADLPPIPAEVFAQKVLEMQEQQQMQQNNGSSNGNSRRQVTKKDLKRQEKEAKRQQALEAKLSGIHFAESDVTPSQVLAGSHDFVSNSEQSATDTESESDASVSVDGPDYRPMDDVDRLLDQKLKNYQKLPSNVSFMDNHESESVEENAKYLEKKYGIVFPEEDHISDWDGLITYLNEKVALGNCCLSCTYMGRSLEACRAHMLAKQHIKIPFDTAEEQEELLDFYDFELETEDDEWEDVDDESEKEYESDVMSVSTLGNTPFVSSGFELVVNPQTGATAGHRSLQRYYRQRAMNPIEKPGTRAVKMLEYASPGVSARAADKMVKQTWSEEFRARQKNNYYHKRLNNQKHFRDQLLQ